MNWLWNIDQKVFYIVHVILRNKYLNCFFIAITDTGNWQFQTISFLLFSIKKSTRQYAIIIGGTVLFQAILRSLVVLYVHRMRPTEWWFSTPLIKTEKFTSFPSGHTSSTFCIAMITTLLVWNTKCRWIGWTLFGWATIIAYSRIYLGVHYLTDIIAGALWGLIWAIISYVITCKAKKLPGQSEIQAYWIIILFIISVILLYFTIEKPILSWGSL